MPTTSMITTRPAGRSPCSKALKIWWPKSAIIWPTSRSARKSPKPDTAARCASTPTDRVSRQFSNRWGCLACAPRRNFPLAKPADVNENPAVPLKDLFSRDNQIRLGLRRRRLGRRLVQWETDGRPPPPPDLVKRGMIKAYARQFSCRYLVETGTYFGETVAAALNSFEKIWSIELAPALAAAARKRFATHQHVQIIGGDS